MKHDSLPFYLDPDRADHFLSRCSEWSFIAQVYVKIKKRSNKIIERTWVTSSADPILLFKPSWILGIWFPIFLGQFINLPHQQPGLICANGIDCHPDFPFDKNPVDSINFMLTGYTLFPVIRDR
jgi:hypothetical protein